MLLRRVIAIAIACIMVTYCKAKVEGPYYLASFTGHTQREANVVHADRTAWRRKISDLSRYTGNA